MNGVKFDFMVWYNRTLLKSLKDVLCEENFLAAFVFAMKITQENSVNVNKLLTWMKTGNASALATKVVKIAADTGFADVAFANAKKVLMAFPIG